MKKNNKKEESNNFLQVGKMIECGTCHPEKFGDCKELRKFYKFECQCICHTPSEEKKEWEKEFDNLIIIEKDELTREFTAGELYPSALDKIKSFIRTLLTSTEKRVREETIKEFETMMDKQRQLKSFLNKE